MCVCRLVIGLIQQRIQELINAVGFFLRSMLLVYGFTIWKCLCIVFCTSAAVGLGTASHTYIYETPHPVGLFLGLSAIFLADKALHSFRQLPDDFDKWSNKIMKI